MKRQLLMVMVLTGSVLMAHAEEQQAAQTENVLKTDASTVQAAPKDIDDEITNARLRAQLGSKNRWSFKSALGYNGGSIEKPMAEVRPNYRAGANREALPALSGTVGINYRVNERDSLSFGTGLTVIEPFHGDLGKNAPDKRRGGNVDGIERYQVATPQLDWSRGYKAFGTQMISGAGISYYTDSDSADANALGDISLTQTVLANLGDSRWQAGLTGAFQYSVYGGNVKAEVDDLYSSGAVKRDEVLLAAYPFAEYSFSDRYSFRTVFGYFEFSKYKDEYGNVTSFRQVEPYQSMGIGISVTRDIYLYPNIQFAPKDVRADRTNIALSTNINI